MLSAVTKGPSRSGILSAGKESEFATQQIWLIGTRANIDAPVSRLSAAVGVANADTWLCKWQESPKVIVLMAPLSITGSQHCPRGNVQGVPRKGAEC